MSTKFSYSEVGVDRKLREKSKKALSNLEKTYGFSCSGEVLKLPFGKVFPWSDSYLDLAIEGVGTKVLIAQLADKLDTIGIDGVAMVVNDVIRSGARPLAIADNIHTQLSDPDLISELLKGIVAGAQEAQTVVPNGEIGDVAEIIKGIHEGKGFDLVVSSIGLVPKEKVISGNKVKPGDSIVGLRSSGVHSNGITLARKVLFRKWGGKYDAKDVPDGLEREVIREVLEPTAIYVKPVLAVAEKLELKAAVHITGDAYMKFDKIKEFSRKVGFEFNNFNPQPIFKVIQDAASEQGRSIDDDEMFKTFNMGWGFALIINEENSEEAIDILEKTGVQAEKIGKVAKNEGVRISYGEKEFRLI